MNSISHLTASLVDGSGLLKTLQGAVQGGYRRSDLVITILDFLSLSESIVLNDEIIVVEAGLGYGVSRNRSPKNEGKCNEGWHELISPLAEAGVIANKPVKATAARIGGDSLQSQGDQFEQDAWFESSRLIGAEAMFKVPATSMIRQREVYEKYSSARIHHEVTNLVGKYHGLKSALEQYRENISPSGYILLPVPPISLQILHNAQNREQLITRLLEIRDEYSGLRDALSSLRQDLADPSLTPEKKGQLIGKWIQSWETLTKYKNCTGAIEVGNTTTGMLRNTELRKEVATSALSLTTKGLISELLEQGRESVASWRVRVLHRTAKQYLCTSDRQILTEIERIFHSDTAHAILDFAKHNRVDS